MLRIDQYADGLVYPNTFLGRCQQSNGYSMPSNSTSKTSVLFGGIMGLGLFAP